MAIFTDQDQLLMERSFQSPNYYTVTTRVYGRRTALGEGTCTIHYRYCVQTSVSVSGMTWGNGGGVWWRDTQHGTIANKGAFSLAATTNEQELFSVDVYVSELNGITLNAYTYTVYNWMGLNEGNSAMSNDSSAFTLPVGINMSNVRRGQTSFTANVSLTGWGGGGSTDERKYRELQCWTQGMSEPRRYQPQYGNSLSGDITVGNGSSGGLTIRPNTMYTLGVYAATRSAAWNDNWAGTGSKNKGDFTTLPPSSTLSLNTAHSDSLDIAYSAPADGGKYTKTLQYSLDGTNWVNGATIATGSATSGTFTIPNLEPNTQYTIRSRVSTSAGTTNNTTITASTIGPATPTVSVDGVLDDEIDLIYGTTTFGGGSNGVVRLYMDTNSTPTTEVDSSTQTGSNYCFYSPIQLNQCYYARARAEATFDGTVVYSDYSPTIPIVTRCASLKFTSLNFLRYETISTVTMRAVVSTVADEGFYPKTLKYRYLVNGVYSEWTDFITYNDGAAHTCNIDISGLPVDTNVNVYVKIATQAGETSTISLAKKTPAAHRGPYNFNYSIGDQNTSLQTWLSSFSGYTNPIYVQNQSQVTLTIPNATKGTCRDSTSIQKYVSTLVVDNNSQTTTTFVYPITVAFGNHTPINRATDFPSNEIKIRSRVYDTLDAYTEVEKTTLALSWQAPTVILAGERLSKMGTARIDFSGTYARLQDNSLNSGNDMNSIVAEYRVLDMDDNVLQNWTPISTISTTIDENKPFLQDYSARTTIENIPIKSACKIETRVQDHFTTVTDDIVLDIWELGQVNDPVAYDIELWDWKSNTYVADLSYLVVGDLNFEWILNDVEQVSFEMDLFEYEKKCEEMGVDSKELLKPYAHDIRIRRNGKYILGCQLTEANIKVSQEPPAKIQVKGVGFLNLFKDQYIMQEAWGDYTYAQIARKLVSAAQKPNCIVKNPTGDLDASYWLAANGTVAWQHNDGGGYEGSGYIAGSRSGNGWVTFGTQMDCDSTENIVIDMWIKGQVGRTVYVRERQYVTQYTGQKTFIEFVSTGQWQHIQVVGTTRYTNGYLIVEMDRTDTTRLRVDSVYVYKEDDDSALCNMFVKLGTDTASPNQQDTRQVTYELQNVKDALMDLTEFEEDNFDFEFLPDRTFNIYERKGEDKLDLNIVYPGNIANMSIQRSAANVANKVTNIGSGIGDERIQFTADNAKSRREIGTREAIITNSNVSMQQTLMSQTVQTLYNRKDPTDLPTITIADGSISPENVETGDVIFLQIQDDTYLDSASGEYRIIQMSVSVSENSVETVNLTLEKTDTRPEPVLVRYIRDSVNGSSANESDHWVEIQGLMLQGNSYINVALNKPVTSSGTEYSGEPLSRVTDGNTDTNYYAGLNEKGNQAVTIDLGAEYPLDYVKVWHYYGDERTYHSPVLSVGTTLPDGLNGKLPLEHILWANDEWAETSAGRKSQWIQNINVTEHTSPKKIRYIKESIKGNSVNTGNHWVEVEAYEKLPDGTLSNIALHKTVIADSRMTNPSRITDGVIATGNNYAGIDKADGLSMTIDLGDEYPIDYIKIWHFYEDNRTYYGSTLSVGNELKDGDEPLDTIVWQYGDNEGWVETSWGRQSPWIQGLL